MEWNVAVEFSQAGYGIEEMPLPQNQRAGTGVTNSPEPYLEIIIQPQSKFRFRYKSEMSGKHGSLLGSTSHIPQPHSPLCPTQTEFKTYPTVKLHNFSATAIVRCSLVCDTPPYYPHAHLLSLRTSRSSSPSTPSPSASYTALQQVMEPESQPYVEGIISPENNYTSIFQGLNIIYTGKKSVRNEIVNKIHQLEEWDERKIRLDKQINDMAMGMNLNVVSLYFEAFVQNGNDEFRRICPPVISQPIQHNKSTQTGELRIVRIDKYSGFCTGDEEVFILVEKVDKHNIQVKFYQENENGVEIWKAYGKFSKLDVHHQYAIVFKTPPYRSCDIDTDVDVWIQLERPSDGATSQQIRFKYKPIERLRKMPRHTKPRNDDRRGGSGSQDRRSPNYREADEDQSRYSDQNMGGAGADPGGSGMPTPSSSSVRQGANPKFPCELVRLRGAPNLEKANKAMALNVALSVGESLHCWAETSNFNVVLQKLRHLLCLVNENGDNALHTAILNEQQEPFTQILNTIGTSSDISSIINDRNLDGLTPLAMAVLLNAETYVEQLLDSKADITIPNLEGDSPIHIAVKANHVNCLKLLLCSNSSYEAINGFNYSICQGFADAVSMLSASKANVAAQEGTYGRTPLHLAVEKGSLSSAFLLLKSATDMELVNIQNYRGDTPLHCAVSMDSPNPTMCALLLYFGADPLIENFMRKECEEGEVQTGNTVFDLVTNDEILKILQSSSEDWEHLLKCCSNVMESPTRLDPEQILSLDSLYVDSGIDIKDAS